MKANYTNASEQIITNCDVGPACGMMDLVYLTLATFAIAVIVVTVQNHRGDENGD